MSGQSQIERDLMVLENQMRGLGDRESADVIAAARFHIEAARIRLESLHDILKAAI